MTVQVTHGVGAVLAAYQAPYLTRLLVQQGFAVRPLLSPGAEAYVSELTFRALAHVEPGGIPYPHLEPADLLVIAPLDVATLGRLALGLAGDLVSETALAHRGPLVLAPSLPGSLADAPQVKEHLALLAERDGAVIVPAAGESPDQMAAPESVLVAVLQAVQGLQAAD